MSGKSKIFWLAAVGVTLTLLLAGCGSSGQANTAKQTGSVSSPPARTQQRQQFRQDFRSGKVVTVTATSVTVAIRRGGADVGKNATYNLTGSTVVHKDRSTVSTSGQVPDLASLGLRTGYWAALLVKDGNVVSIQFRSNGAQPQRPPHRNYGTPPGSQGSSSGHTNQ